MKTVWVIVLLVSAYGYEVRTHPQNAKERYVFSSVEACAKHVTRRWREIIAGLPIKPQWIDCEPTTIKR